MIIHLHQIAYARSGDKGCDANVGVIAYTHEGYQFITHFLTAELLHYYLNPTGVLDVKRYELPNLLALNFVLKGALGKGASQSLRIDAQGKALGQIVLEMRLEISDELLPKCLKNDCHT